MCEVTGTADQLTRLGFVQNRSQDFIKEQMTLSSRWQPSIENYHSFGYLLRGLRRELVYLARYPKVNESRI